MHARRFIVATMAILTLQPALAMQARPRQRPQQQPPARQAPEPQPPAQQPQPTEAAAPHEEPSAPPAQPSPEPPQAQSADHGVVNIDLYPASGRDVLRTPVSKLFPGDAPAGQPVKNPVDGDPEAIQRGMSYFNTFNCVGCHAPNGGGGMGPALSNNSFIYGGEPGNIYLSIYQGRPNGMPAWGAALPESIIWDLVSYIQSISKEPTTGWGKTASHDAWKIEQLPAEFSQTATPWSHTEKFSAGQSPARR